MNARTHSRLAVLLCVLAWVMVAGGAVWSANALTDPTAATITASLAVAAALFALVTLAGAWIVALRVVRGQAQATFASRWLLPAALAMALPLVSLWGALTVRSLRAGEWSVALELLGLLPLSGALLSPLAGLLALGLLLTDAARAEHPAAGDTLPPYWSAAPLTAEDIAREMAEATGETEPRKPPVAPEAPAPADDLTRIKGIGPKTARALHAGGITTFAALASAEPAVIGRILQEAGVRPGDIDAWRAQAAREGQQAGVE
ncbi:MAG: hypothetical protein Kow00120_19670 [Anaerolineae bacterium]